MPLYESDRDEFNAATQIQRLEQVEKEAAELNELLNNIELVINQQKAPESVTLGVLSVSKA